MNQRPHARLAELLKQCDPEAILRAASLCDGHTIFVPKVFVDAGLPSELVGHLTATHRSDGSPKGTIFVGGRPTPELRGVYGLELLRFLADASGVECPRPMGRGSEARIIVSALQRRLGPPVDPPVA